MLRQVVARVMRLKAYLRGCKPLRPIGRSFEVDMHRVQYKRCENTWMRSYIAMLGECVIMPSMGFRAARRSALARARLRKLLSGVGLS